MKNIHVLPTDKPSRLYKQLDNPLVITNNPIEDRKFGRWCINQNIYITSNKFPCMNRYYLLNDNVVCKKDETYFATNWKEREIILTTDQDLIKDGVQAIPDEFLEWFVKNPSCEWIEVNKKKDINITGVRYSDYVDTFSYKIIIPKEQVLLQSSIDGEVIWGEKQETLEEVKDLNYWRNNAEEDYLKVPISVLRYISELEKQQERSYSKEDIIEFAYNYIDERRDQGARAMTPELLIKQFKNK